MNEVWVLLDESLWYAHAILEGGTNKEGTFYPSENPQVRQKIKDVISSIEAFKEAGKVRYDNYTPGHSGNPHGNGHGSGSGKKEPARVGFDLDLGEKTANDEFVLILDIDRVFEAGELEALQETKEEVHS